jgi:hypothetical protein
MTIFCCKEIEFFLKENEVSISYDSSERSYGILYKPDTGGGKQQIHYCPWCGNKFPKTLSEELSNIIFDELNLDGYDDPRLPSEFKTDEWWKKRNL